MATFYSPKIATNGLVLYLDAGNKKSYDRNGITDYWYDLSGNNNTATMYGDVNTLYSTDANGCFTFASATGTYSGDSTLGFTFSSNMVPTTGNFTLECWVKNVTNSSGQTGMFSNAGSADGYRFGVGYDGVYCLIGPNYTEFGIGFTSNLDSTLWYHVVTTWDRTSAYRINLYRNGSYQNNGGIPSTQTAMQNGAPGIVRSPCCGIYKGKLAIMKVYNRLLTTAEILQNYNATKGRFGL
jgi:hypothetical protein